MRKLSIILFLSLFASSVWACDICGCQLGGYSFGILSQNPTHFIGIRYNQSHFEAHIDNQSIPDEYSDDTYRTMELMGRYVISKRWQLSAIVPYSINSMDGNSQKTEVNGIGDPILMGYFNVLNTSSENFRDLNHSLLVGAGLKFPVGTYDAAENDVLINRNFQLGSGSLDYILSGIYTVKYKSFGLNLEGSYKMNTENDLHYRFGNQLGVSAKAYYALIQPSYSLLPYVGMTYEQSEIHTDEGFKQVNTGGNALLGTLGMQAFVSRIMLMASYSIPIKQDYNTDQRSTIESQQRFQLGVVFNIPSKSSREIML
ncbi:Putative MetA-pathway of phenol degradation [Reichenbachiella agariperforans]|uniref:Putative MetA-pathway of phenol degradation n=1 Tax=Reichenbachiella agariperforans TaxID=156994 RepID=A0A1M6VM15_REIAG|nr:transporter [Reichenbachiella agariperforans]SHK82587.1 Putative MetA-pathway of phenol degradation [Reichenbachiella agariperforans]